MTPAEISEETRAVERTLLQDYRLALGKRGVTTDTVAKLRTQELKAKKVSHIKIKGVLPAGIKLPRGYRLITTAERKTIIGQDGTEMLVDPGDTVIEYTGVDWAVRDKALQAIEAIMGYRTEQTEGGGGTTIIVQTMIAAPRPAVDDDILAAIWSGKAPGNGNGNGNGGKP